MKILSGVFEDPDTGAQVTTGTPISLLIENTDQRRKIMARSKTNTARHADFTIWKNTAFAIIAAAGALGPRNGARVAASAVARKVLDGVTIRGALVQMGRMKSIAKLELGRS